MERILEFRNQGITIIFVSHNMEEIRSLCSKVSWLDHGSIKMTGEPGAVIEAYESYHMLPR
jgi:teichoic acid transport system ATP-binding protein